jgi:hypothetical protein
MTLGKLRELRKRRGLSSHSALRCIGLNLIRHLGGLPWGGAALRVSSGIVVRRAPLAHRGGPLFHKAKGPALFHSTEGVDKLVSFENG